MHRSPGFASVLATLAALAACDTTTLGPDAVDSQGFYDGAPVDANALDRGLPANYDDPGTSIPGFGGLWFDRACNLHVVLTAAGDPQQAKQALTPLLRRRIAASRRCPDDATIIVHRGDFTWAQLARWLHELRPAADIPGVYGIAINVPANRIVIGVRGRASADAVLELLDRLGIPHEAVIFRSATGSGDRGRR